MNQLRESSADNVKAAVAEVKKMESSIAEEAAAPVASAQPLPAPRPNAFSAKPAPPAAAPAAAGRPSFAATQPVSTSTPRPSLGGAPAAPTANAAPSRPSFGGPSNLPPVRGAFVRDPSKMGSASPASSHAPSASSDMNPQALFEIVCTHRKLSEQAIEAAKNQARDNPDAVLAQMRRIYDQEIAPARTRHTSDLPTAKEAHPGKVVFLLRKDDKERIRVMSQEEAVATGEIVLDGTVVENIHAAASPFSPPSQLFATPAVSHDQEQAAEPQQPVEQVVHRSPKP